MVSVHHDPSGHHRRSDLRILCSPGVQQIKQNKLVFVVYRSQHRLGEGLVPDTGCAYVWSIPERIRVLPSSRECGVILTVPDVRYH